MLIACLWVNSLLPLRVPLLPIMLGVGNCCSFAEKRDTRADTGAGLVVAVVVGHYWCTGGESVVCDEWTWYCGGGCEDGRVGGQEGECEDCDGEWVMRLHGEGYLGLEDGVESLSWYLPFLKVSSRRFNEIR
jgi:hypothetical protein